MQSSKSVGFIEKGTGKHQSNTVWDKRGCSPTEDTKTSIWIIGDKSEIKRIDNDRSNE